MCVGILFLLKLPCESCYSIPDTGLHSTFVFRSVFTLKSLPLLLCILWVWTLFWTDKSTLIFWRQISWCNQFGHFHEQKDLKDNRKCQSWSPLPLTFTFFTRSFGPHRRTLSNLSFYSLTSCGARSEVLSYNNAAIHRRVVRHPSTAVPWVMSCVRLYLEEVQASMLPRSAGMILNPLTGVIIV